MVKKWIDCTIDEKLEAVKTDIDELYKRIDECGRLQEKLAIALLEVQQKIKATGLSSES
jgi:hypothetical protein